MDDCVFFNYFFMPLSEIPDVVSVGLPTTHRDNTFEHLPKEEEGATSEQIGKILWRILE